jgi:hypothetical protein
MVFADAMSDHQDAILPSTDVVIVENNGVCNVVSDAFQCQLLIAFAIYIEGQSYTFLNH